MNGDDHDRILRLEDKMDTLMEKVAALSGGLKVWAVVLGLVASIAGTVLTNALLRPHDPAESLEQEIKGLRHDLQEQNRKEVSR